jgi:peptidoglycan hydrolase-like protein with peptidoglycan-binding domain
VERDEGAFAERRPRAAAPSPELTTLLLRQSAGNAAVARLLQPTEEAAGTQPLLRRGSRGPAVSDCQAKLNVAVPPAAPSLKVDAIFGPLTRGAVVDFQTGNDLKPDGIVGPLTRAALDAQQQVPPQAIPPDQLVPPQLVPPQQVPPQQVPPVVSVPAAGARRAATGLKRNGRRVPLAVDSSGC